MRKRKTDYMKEYLDLMSEARNLRYLELKANEVSSRLKRYIFENTNINITDNPLEPDDFYYPLQVVYESYIKTKNSYHIKIVPMIDQIVETATKAGLNITKDDHLIQELTEPVLWF